MQEAGIQKGKNLPFLWSFRGQLFFLISRGQVLVLNCSCHPYWFGMMRSPTGWPPDRLLFSTTKKHVKWVFFFFFGNPRMVSPPPSPIPRCLPPGRPLHRQFDAPSSLGRRLPLTSSFPGTAAQRRRPGLARDGGSWQGGSPRLESSLCLWSKHEGVRRLLLSPSP